MQRNYSIFTRKKKKRLFLSRFNSQDATCSNLTISTVNEICELIFIVPNFEENGIRILGSAFLFAGNFRLFC